MSAALHDANATERRRKSVSATRWRTMAKGRCGLGVTWACGGAAVWRGVAWACAGAHGEAIVLAPLGHIDGEDLEARVAEDSLGNDAREPERESESM